MRSAAAEEVRGHVAVPERLMTTATATLCGVAPHPPAVFDGEHGVAGREKTHEGYKASRPRR